MISNKDNQPKAVPLVELLESVPVTCHEMIEVGYCHHRNIPYGRYCQEAAKEIRRLQKLEIVVKKVLAQKGDDVCWMDVYTEMAELVGVSFDPKMLPREQMLKNCEHFVDCLLGNKVYKAPVI